MRVTVRLLEQTVSLISLSLSCRIRQVFNKAPKSFVAPLYLGEIFLEQKNYDQAKKLFLKANKRSNGTYRHVLYRLGQLHVEMKEFQSAVEVFEAITKMDSNYKDVRSLLKTAKRKAN